MSSDLPVITPNVAYNWYMLVAMALPIRPVNDNMHPMIINARLSNFFTNTPARGPETQRKIRKRMKVVFWVRSPM
jgi:hypothetical protein